MAKKLMRIALMQACGDGIASKWRLYDSFAFVISCFAFVISCLISICYISMRMKERSNQ